ncbi:hypothetical protein H0H92_005759 [Tricholoma furcatifolium]|nr:hypothetical protein H0H92_005759 [Tricholoma furcatifolium]
MFTNRISRIHRLAVRVRNYSLQQQKTYPFTKLRAYPFQLSPEDAVVQMAPWGSSVSLFKQFIGSLGARYLPGFGFEPFRPVQMTPVYFPAWLIDAELSLDVVSEDGDNKFAAYPVLIPLYLAQYKLELAGNREKFVTLFIEASTPNGRIRCEKLSITNELKSFPDAPKHLVDMAHAFDELDITRLRGEFAPFVHAFGFHVSGKRGVGTTINDWINNAIVSHDAGPLLVEKSGIITSDDDPRIRPCTLEERRSVEKWLLLSQEIQSITRVAGSFRATNEAARSQGGVVPQDLFDNTIKTMEQKIAELKAEQDEITPSWWKEWKQSSN